MELVNNLEKTLAGWYQNAPHLPVNGRKWLGENVWWIVVIGLVFTAFGLLALIPITLVGLGLGTFIATSSYAAYGYASDSLALFWVTTLFSLISLVVTAIILAMAISPLKAKAKKGWKLLFIVLLVSFVLVAVSDLIVLNIGGVVWAVLWAAIEAYFLFEIRGEFGKEKATVKAKTAKKS